MFQYGLDLNGSRGAPLVSNSWNVSVRIRPEWVKWSPIGNVIHGMFQYGLDLNGSRGAPLVSNSWNVSVRIRPEWVKRSPIGK